MAVLKYRKPNGEFVEVIAPLNVISGTVEPSEPEEPVVPDVPVEPEVTTPTLPFPNMYFDCVFGYPMRQMEINVQGIKTLTFEYDADPWNDGTRGAITVSILMGGRYLQRTGSLPLIYVNGTKETIYVLKDLKTSASGIFELDVEAYDTIVISLSGGSPSKGYIILKNFTVS